MVLSGINPKEVFYYFEEICAIPHGSGNTEELAEYCLAFAKEKGLRACQDKAGNVMIFAEATEGYEDSEPVILQGHMDMVCDKTADCGLDMEKEGLVLQTDGKYVWAEGTTLGGDDGIAVAYILALLASKEIPHPPIEALLTADEETTMSGAEELEEQFLRGKRLINLDSEEEGVLTVSCAGGVSAHSTLPLVFEEVNVEEYDKIEGYEISISDLQGGHSGSEIHKPRANAILLLAGMLKELKKDWDFALTAFAGGSKENAIPKEAGALLCVSSEDAEDFEEAVLQYADRLTIELEEAEPELCVTVAQMLTPVCHMDKKSTDAVLGFLTDIPNGVDSMSQDIEGLVQTSSNLGIILTGEDGFHASVLIRSSVTKEKEELKNKISHVAKLYGGSTEFEADYPSWEYAEESPLREKMAEVYEEMYGEKMKVEAVHAGLECGFLAGKIPGIDMVSFGPNLEGVHTPDEKMEIASVERCWKYLLKVLENLK